ncbi:MAG TPA: hypothetical protein VIP28_04005 [Nocardioides sp.]
MTRRDVFAAAAHLPWLAFEFAELRRGDLGMPYTRYVRKIPRWLRRALIIAAAVVAWFHFDDQ